MKIKALCAFLMTSLMSVPAFAEVPLDVAAYLNPSRNLEVGMVFEAFLSPHQESGEEEDTPAGTSEAFLSTEPSRSRDERAANGHRGHALLRFTKDMSKAYVDVKLEAMNVTASDDIVMFHIHCGRPGILGPIIIDFALATDIHQNLADGVIISVELTNQDLVDNIAVAADAVGAFTRGCFIPSLNPESIALTKTTTIAGMAHIAQEGELYFNLHTKGQTYYGDMRGQVYPAETSGGFFPKSRSADGVSE